MPVDQAQALLEGLYGFLHQFDGACFSAVARLGDPDIYRAAVSDVSISVDTALGPNALYSPSVLGNSLTLSRDPRAAAGDWIFQQTVWHELTHHAENVHGDFSAPDAGNRDYDERNTEYIEVVAEQLVKLQHLEQLASQGAGEPAQLRTQLASILDRLRQAEAGDGKPFAPDLDTLESWTGVRARADEIETFYRSGGCGGSLALLP